MNTLTSLLNKNATTNTVAPCPYPFTQVIYECFYAHQKKLTWPQARRVCQGMGGDLANPEHPFAPSDLPGRHLWWKKAPGSVKIYGTERWIGPGYFWVGGTDVGAEGTWQWVSDRPVDPEEWLFSRPDNRAGDEHCLEIVMSDYPGLYNDETCSIAQRFICQYRH
ncbi:perlucin-like [Homarus americanus]|uniref:perlucin-like n=1 Tax=Homarus americanus TaxID=6706 RepID=UPI001C45771D|nr:perlucin-like [Homarus americanus]